MSDDNEDKNKKKDSAGKGVKVVCTKKRQWNGRLIRPGEELTLPGGIPEGFEDFFKPAS